MLAITTAFLALLAAAMLRGGSASMPSCRGSSITITEDLTIRFPRSEVGMDWACLSGSLRSADASYFKVSVEAESMDGFALQFLIYNKDGDTTSAYQSLPTSLLRVYAADDSTGTTISSGNLRTAYVDGASVFVAGGLELQNVCQGEYLVQVKVPTFDATVNYGLLVRMVEGERSGSGVRFPAGPALSRTFTAAEAGIDSSAMELTKTTTTGMGVNGAFVTRGRMVWGDEVEIPIGEDWATAKRPLHTVRTRIEGPSQVLLRDRTHSPPFFAEFGGGYRIDAEYNNPESSNIYIFNGTATRQESTDLETGYVAMESPYDYDELMGGSTPSVMTMQVPYLYPQSGTPDAADDMQDLVQSLGSAGIFADMRVMIVESMDYPELDLRSGGSQTTQSMWIDTEDPLNSVAIFSVLVDPYWSNVSFSQVAAEDEWGNALDMELISVEWSLATADFTLERLGTDSWKSPNDAATMSALNVAWWDLTDSQRGLWESNSYWLADATALGPSYKAGARLLVRVKLGGCGASDGALWPADARGAAVTNASVTVRATVHNLAGECRQHSDCMVKRDHPGKDRKGDSANNNVDRLSMCGMRSEPLGQAVHMQPVARCFECYLDSDCAEGQYCQNSDTGLCTSPDARRYVCDTESFATYRLCRDKKKDFDALGLKCRDGSATLETTNSGVQIVSNSPRLNYQYGEAKGWANGNGYCGGLKFWNSTALGDSDDPTATMTLNGAIRAVHWTGSCMHGVCQECLSGSGGRECINGRLLDRVDVEGTVRTLGHDTQAQAAIFVAFAAWALLLLVPAYFICETNRHREKMGVANASCLHFVCATLCFLPTCHNSCGRLVGVYGGRARPAGAGGDDGAGSPATQSAPEPNHARGARRKTAAFPRP